MTALRGHSFLLVYSMSLPLVDYSHSQSLLLLPFRPPATTSHQTRSTSAYQRLPPGVVSEALKTLRGSRVPVHHAPSTQQCIDIRRILPNIGFSPPTLQPYIYKPTNELRKAPKCVFNHASTHPRVDTRCPRNTTRVESADIPERRDDDRAAS